MSNRYSDYSVSAYDPMSFEDIARVPMMKRQQHNSILEQASAIRAGLVKTDPSSKFFNEAVTLKNNIENKLNDTVSELNKTGFNNNMIDNITSANKEYQDLVSPTGKIGQINNEKINTKKEYDKSIENALKMGQSQSRAEYWANKSLTKYNDVNQVPLYDDNGRIIDFKVEKAAPKRYDLAELTQNIGIHSGMKTAEWEKSRSAIGLDKNNRFVVDTKKGGLGAGNIEGLQKAAAYLNLRVDSKNDPLREDMDYNLITSEEAKLQIANQLGIYVTKTNKNIDDESKHDVKWGEGSTNTPNDTEFVSVGQKVGNTTKFDTYTEGNSRLKELKSREKLSPDELIEYNKLNYNHTKSDDILKNDPKYIKANNDYQEKLKSYNEESKLQNRVGLSMIII